MSAMAGGSGVPATCGLLPLRWDSRSTLPAGTMQMPCYGRLSQALHLCCNSAALSRGIFQDVSRDDIVIIVGLVDLNDGATSLLHVLHDCIHFVSPLRYFECRALARMRGHIRSFVCAVLSGLYSVLVYHLAFDASCICFGMSDWLL